MARAWICDICESKSPDEPHRYQIIIADQQKTVHAWPEVCEKCKNSILVKINNLAGKPSLRSNTAAVVQGRFVEKQEGDPGTFSHCGSAEVHGPHQHDTTAMNDGPYVGLLCRGTPQTNPMPDPGFWTWREVLD